eukprot:351465-Chlamydomonas_euryale.AAC.1
MAREDCRCRSNGARLDHGQPKLRIVLNQVESFARARVPDRPCRWLRQHRGGPAVLRADDGRQFRRRAGLRGCSSSRDPSSLLSTDVRPCRVSSTIRVMELARQSRSSGGGSAAAGLGDGADHDRLRGRPNAGRSAPGAAPAAVQRKRRAPRRRVRSRRPRGASDAERGCEGRV